MTYPTAITFRREQLARAARTLDADSLRVFVAIATRATDTGRAWFSADHLARELRLDVPTVHHVLRRIAEADLIERLPAWRDAIETIEMGPVFVRAHATPTNLPAEPI